MEGVPLNRTKDAHLEVFFPPMPFFSSFLRIGGVRAKLTFEVKPPSHKNLINHPENFREEEGEEKNHLKDSSADVRRAAKVH